MSSPSDQVNPTEQHVDQQAIMKMHQALSQEAAERARHEEDADKRESDLDPNWEKAFGFDATTETISLKKLRDFIAHAVDFFKHPGTLDIEKRIDYLFKIVKTIKNTVSISDDSRKTTNLKRELFIILGGVDLDSIPKAMRKVKIPKLVELLDEISNKPAMSSLLQDELPHKIDKSKSEKPSSKDTLPNKLIIPGYRLLQIMDAGLYPVMKQLHSIYATVNKMDASAKEPAEAKALRKIFEKKLESIWYSIMYSYRKDEAASSGQKSDEVLKTIQDYLREKIYVYFETEGYFGRMILILNIFGQVQSTEDLYRLALEERKKKDQQVKLIQDKANEADSTFEKLEKKIKEASADIEGQFDKDAIERDIDSYKGKDENIRKLVSEIREELQKIEDNVDGQYAAAWAGALQGEASRGVKAAELPKIDEFSALVKDAIEHNNLTAPMKQPYHMARIDHDKLTKLLQKNPTIEQGSEQQKLFDDFFYGIKTQDQEADEQIKQAYESLNKLDDLHQKFLEAKAAAEKEAERKRQADAEAEQQKQREAEEAQRKQQEAVEAEKKKNADKGGVVPNAKALLQKRKDELARLEKEKSAKGGKGKKVDFDGLDDSDKSADADKDKSKEGPIKKLQKDDASALDAVPPGSSPVTIKLTTEEKRLLDPIQFSKDAEVLAAELRRLLGETKGNVDECQAWISRFDKVMPADALQNLKGSVAQIDAPYKDHKQQFDAVPERIAKVIQEINDYNNHKTEEKKDACLDHARDLLESLKDLLYPHVKVNHFNSLQLRNLLRLQAAEIKGLEMMKRAGRIDDEAEAAILFGDALVKQLAPYRSSDDSSENDATIDQIRKLAGQLKTKAAHAKAKAAEGNGKANTANEDLLKKDAKVRAARENLNPEDVKTDEFLTTYNGDIQNADQDCDAADASLQDALKDKAEMLKLLDDLLNSIQNKASANADAFVTSGHAPSNAAMRIAKARSAVDQSSKGVADKNGNIAAEFAPHFDEVRKLLDDADAHVGQAKAASDKIDAQQVPAKAALQSIQYARAQIDAVKDKDPAKLQPHLKALTEQADELQRMKTADLANISEVKKETEDANALADLAEELAKHLERIAELELGQLINDDRLDAARKANEDARKYLNGKQYGIKPVGGMLREQVKEIMDKKLLSEARYKPFEHLLPSLAAIDNIENQGKGQRVETKRSKDRAEQGVEQAKQALADAKKALVEYGQAKRANHPSAAHKLSALNKILDGIARLNTDTGKEIDQAVNHAKDTKESREKMLALRDNFRNMMDAIEDQIYDIAASQSGVLAKGNTDRAVAARARVANIDRACGHPGARPHVLAAIDLANQMAAHAEASQHHVNRIRNLLTPLFQELRTQKLESETGVDPAARAKALGEFFRIEQDIYRQLMSPGNDMNTFAAGIRFHQAEVLRIESDHLNAHLNEAHRIQAAMTVGLGSAPGVVASVAATAPVANPQPLILSKAPSQSASRKDISGDYVHQMLVRRERRDA